MDKSKRCFLGLAGGALLGGVPLVRAVSATEDSHREQGSSGKQWAMVIDVRKCLEREDCTACQDACHLAHNVPKIEGIKEEIKWIWREQYPHAFPNQIHPHIDPKLKNGAVPILCNHCESPACVRVCPTSSTWKREDGVVMMDMHRCIGCRYCMAACPYGARSFNFKDPRPHIAKQDPNYPTRSMGVVEKCNFCAERLAKGQEPLCSEACKKIDCGAIVFGDINQANSKVAELLRKHNTIRRKPGLGTGPQVYYIV
jgi:[DsrC]-trisulfide reductase subunit O